MFNRRSGWHSDSRLRRSGEKRTCSSFALLSAENILKFYDTYYQTKYPFQKLDIIAFPDFSAGAMENTAAITYRETLLTIDDKNASVDAHQAVVSVCARDGPHVVRRFGHHEVVG